jgi:glycosyltransferase involved in cell wall biosynthesis
MINVIKEHDLSKEVKIIPFQRNPYKFIKLCNLFILSSAFEGLPNVLLEAICLRKFVISSKCPTGPNEILNGGKGGFLFKVGDFEELAKTYKYAGKDLKDTNDLLYGWSQDIDKFIFNILF